MGRAATATPALVAITRCWPLPPAPARCCWPGCARGRANTARGAAHFLRETVGRVRYGGARGQLTVRADSGFYTHAVVALCRQLDVRFSITIRQHATLRKLIEAIPEREWTPIPYWMDGAAAVAETTYTPFQAEADAAPVRLIVRRVKPTPGSQLALFATCSYHGFITDRDGDTLELEADHHRHAEVENATRDLKHGVGLNHLPSGRCAANTAWLAVQVMAHNLARWAARIGLGEATATTKTLRRRFFSLAGRLTRSARHLTLHLPKGWPWETQFSRPWPGCKQLHSQPDHPATTGLTLQTIEHPRKLAPVRPRETLAAWSPANLTQRRHCGPPLEHRTTAAGRHQPHLLGPSLNRCVPTPIIPRLASITTPLRWIWS